MREQLTHAIEDYLKAIYKLTATGGRATTTNLAILLGVTPASVTGMVQRLASADPSWVDYQKHHGVSDPGGKTRSAGDRPPPSLDRDVLARGT